MVHVVWLSHHNEVTCMIYASRNIYNMPIFKQIYMYHFFFYVYRASMEFWSIEQPTRTLTYTLTISAPVLLEDWLVPLEHDPVSPKEEKEQLETLGNITMTIENNTTGKSPWDVILNYTAPKMASATAISSSFETWSKRAQVRRARKSNGKGAQSGTVGGAGAKAGGNPVAIGKSSSGLLTQREGEGGAMPELYQILQPVANGLTSGKPLNQAIATASSSSSRVPSHVQAAVPQPAESALLAAAAKTAMSASEITNAVSQSPFPITGSSTSSTTWNGSISPTGSEITTSATVSNTTNSKSSLQAINVSMNGPLQLHESQVLVTTFTTQSHQSLSSTPQLVSSIPQIMESTTMKASIPQQSISSLPQISATSSKAREGSMPHPPISSTPQTVDSETTKEPIPQQSISSLPKIIASTVREGSLSHQPISSTPQIAAMCSTAREGSMPHQPPSSTPQIMATCSSTREVSLSQTVTNVSMGVPLTTVSSLHSRPITAAHHINTSGVNHSENSLSNPEASSAAVSGSSSSESMSIASPTTIPTTSTNQANTRLNQANQGSQVVCNTALNQLIPGASLTSTNAGSSENPSQLSASQALYTSVSNEKLPKVSHIPPVCVPMSKSNGALSESFLKEVMNPAVFSSFISPQVHVVKGDAVTATLMFTNDASSIPSSGSYEVDIVKIQNNQLSVTKETDSVAKEKMDIEGAVTSDRQGEISPTEDQSTTKNESEISVGNEKNDAAKEVITVNEGEEHVGGAKPTEGEITDSSRDTKETTNSAKSTERNLSSLDGQQTPESKTTPTPTSPKPTTPTSTVSVTSSNSSIPAFSFGPKPKSPPTSGPRSPPTSPVIAVFQNMTYVPYISNNHLYLYPVSPHSLMGHTPSQQSPSHMQFVTTPPGLNMPLSPQQQRNELPLNQKSVNKFKTPRRRRKQPKSPPTTPQQPHPLMVKPASQASPGSPVTHQRSSEDAVAKSLCLRRKGEGLPVNPFTLTFTVTSSAGHSWSTNSLEGEGKKIYNIILVQSLASILGIALINCSGTGAPNQLCI